MIAALLPALLAVSPCAPVERAASNEGLAAVYAQVAQEEEAQAAWEAAAAAWRSAAALESAGGTADLALKRLCAQEQAELDFEAGLDRFQAGDCPAALPRLEAARSGVDAAAASLLEGICEYELGKDTRAAAAFAAAGALPALRPTSNLYLGLIALRRGDESEATERLRAASVEPGDGLRSLAGPLLRTAERVVIDGALEGGYDSNATLGACPTVLPCGGDDGLASATVNLSVRPLRSNGPFLSVGGGYRKYARLSAFDVGLASGSLGWALAMDRVWASIDYGLDFVSLGAAPWLLRNRGTVRLLLAIGRFAVSAEYALRYDDLLAVDAQGYTGIRHAARLAVAVQLGVHLVELSGLLIRVQAAAPERASLESGGELRWTARPDPRWEVLVATGARWRGFDAVDPDLGVARAELQLDGQLRVDFELTANISPFVVVEGRRIFANVDALSYTRLSATAGVRLWLGVW